LSVLRLKALLFDLDGTLVDTASANYQAYANALREVGVAVEPQAVADASAGRHWKDFLPELLTKAGVHSDPELIARRKGELYRAMVNETRLNEPLLALANASRPSMRTALVTTASAVSVQAVLRHHDAAGVFDVVITGEDVTRHKPDPEAYLVATSRLGLRAEECLAFEDSDVGVASARAAGIAVIRVVA
jgi:HAD superfamily hydrolase (TIGR01509 family)